MGYDSVPTSGMRYFDVVLSETENSQSSESETALVELTNIETVKAEVAIKIKEELVVTEMLSHTVLQY